jgi:hypothetical protein
LRAAVEDRLPDRLDDSDSVVRVDKLVTDLEAHQVCLL